MSKKRPSLKRLLPLAIGLAMAGSFVLMARKTSAGAVHAATSPDWTLLAAAFAISAGVQPLRAWAWASTLRAPIGFRAIFAASAIGSFLDTILPGRLGEASKVGVLRVASGPRWPGLPRAGGSLLCAHLVEAISFAVVGAAAAFFVPLPGWARWTLVVGCLAAATGIGLLAALHRRLGTRLPRVVSSFLAGAAAPRPVLVRVGAILIATWLVRWLAIMFVLKAVGVHVGLGGALLYMVVTGLANTAPLLPGNAGIYQGAALGALAMIGHVGAKAVAVSVIVPVVATVATGAAALIALALFGRRFAELSRAALARA